MLIIMQLVNALPAFMFILFIQTPFLDSFSQITFSYSVLLNLIWKYVNYKYSQLVSSLEAP